MLDKTAHVTTYALAIDEETDRNLNLEFESNNFLTVANLESFYNYRTLGKKYELATSILSNSDYCKKMDIIKSEVKPNQYEVVRETPCESPNVHFMTLSLKKQRINAGLLSIKSNADFEISESFNKILNVFTVAIEENEDGKVRQKPQFCRGLYEISKKKPPCVDCTAICAFSIEDILSSNRGLTQAIINAELEAHKHPKSRKMENSHMRNTREAARELADHYIYSHNMQEKEEI